MPGTTKEKILSILETVTDPEVPVLSVIDLGIVRDVVLYNEDNGIEVIITPTYSGCPAMDVITMNIRLALSLLGFKNIKITQVLSPAWTTDWMSEEGKQKLKDYGIAPPNPKQQVCNEKLFARGSYSMPALQFLSYTSHQRIWFYCL